MARSKAPRKKYRGPTDTYNPIDLARNSCKTITDENRQALLGPALDGFHKLREGKATRTDWNYVIDCLNAGEALAEMRICPEFTDDIAGALAAMSAIAHRMIEGKGSTCYAREIEAIRTGLNSYGAQIKLCSQSEYNKAVNRVRGRLSNGKYLTETSLKAA